MAGKYAINEQVFRRALTKMCEVGDIQPVDGGGFEPIPKRDLTWLEPRDQQERCRMLDRLDAALSGADQMAGALGQTTIDYAGHINSLRVHLRAEREVLLAELEVAK